MKTSACPPARQSRGAFALVTTLLILSLLAIVAVSYLSSMSAERQTAEAYSSKAIAEQAAQTGVDSATAMLAESLRDFPDSATVWDTEQTTNSGTPPSSIPTVNTTNNEGTSLYLRAVPTTSNGTTVANPLPHGTLAAAGGNAYPSNDPSGNDPSNPACQNFVLPLISGVPNGQARLASEKSNIFQSLGAMNLSVSDPAQQTWTDLNVRRSSSDVQGIIGSPPTWTSTIGPKPARAYWVKLYGFDQATGKNDLLTGRYAYWIEDESFRANNNLQGSTTYPQDNGGRTLDSFTGKPRVALPSDLTLVGPLTAVSTQLASYAGDITTLRGNSYPGGFFPDPLAFSHAIDATTTQGKQAINVLQYLTTNQSSALNLSRHGSQRLNLNNAIFTSATTSDIQKQVNQLVQTIEYHLPYFGERFYRISSAANLNDATQVPGSPYSGTYSSATDQTHSQIYHYKVAANLRDYIDTDNQPTMIGGVGSAVGPGNVMALALPGNVTLGTSGNNEIWAQGKEATPLIAEVAVRNRGKITVNNTGNASTSTNHYNLNVDYYIEFWNMSNHDVSASQMNNPSVWVRDQQTWDTYYVGDVLKPDDVPPVGEHLLNNNSPNDTQIDLVGTSSSPVTAGDGTVGPVLFRAGTVTIVTTDPDFKTYIYRERTSSGAHYGNQNNPTDPKGIFSAVLPNVYLCPIVSGTGSRLYTGYIRNKTNNNAAITQVGLSLGQPFEGPPAGGTGSPDAGTEVSLVNSQGYLDVVRGAITKTGRAGYYITIQSTDNDTLPGGWNDFSYGSSIMGNVTDTGGGPSPGGEMASPSQMGDPRTNNEQLMVDSSAQSTYGKTADGTRFVASSRTLGVPNAVLKSGTNPQTYMGLQPDTVTAGQGWPDYYKFPAGIGNNYASPDATTAPALIAGNAIGDIALTSIGQLGDVFDPARLPGTAITPATTAILYSHGGGRTLKIGQHDDLYSDDPSTNVYPASAPSNPSGAGGLSTPDGVPASSGWASWRLADIFDVADPIQLPGRININGIMRDNGAALLSALQGFVFQPKTVSGTSDPVVHGDPGQGVGSPGLAAVALNTSTAANDGFTQIVALMKNRLDAATATTNGTHVKPFFERGEFGEIGFTSSPAANSNPLFGTNSANANKLLVSSVDMNKTTDHSREEMFRRLAQLICTRGNTFTVYVVGQSIQQTSVGGATKITGTQRLRVTFRLVPKALDPATHTYLDFHPAYVVNPDGTLSQNSFDSTAPTTASTNLSQPMPIGVIPRFAKPDRYDVQILDTQSY